MSKPLLAAALLALGACATVKLDVIQVGPWFAPKNWRDVAVFTSREQTARPWGGIAIIHGPRVNAEGSESSLARMKDEARRQAAEMGADAIIVSVDSVPTGPQMGVYQDPELFLSALAIKYVADVSTAAAK